MIHQATERLQKVIAARGIASRRKAEEYIRSGRVRVNGKVVTELGVKVSAKDKIEIDGNTIGQAESFVYILLYKPVKVVTTSSDPQGRTTVHDFLSGVETRVYSVGRLDYDTSGLLLLTNDGEMANRLMHPSYGVEKTYHALVAGDVLMESVTQLRRGIVLEGKKTSPAKVKVLGKNASSTKLEISIHEGRNRQVRKMLEQIGHPCLKLTRIRYGPLNLRGLRPGEWRYLTTIEVEKLQAITYDQNH